MSELDLPPQIGGRYRPIRLLGKGGMGAVYEVEHLRTGQRFAMKVITPQPGASIDRFKREARATSRIKSDHIVQVTDADVAPELNGVPFLVMELLEGSDLEGVTGKNPASPADVVDWLRQVARALAKAHDAGIIHRDLKPENLFLTRREDGSPLVKILDFGIAKILAEGSTLTQSGGILGTPAYMAPEQTDSRGSPITTRADLYALGLIAFKLLTGRMYWRSGSLAQLLTQILAEAMPPASERGSSLGLAFDAWFRRACDRDPAKRFTSAVEQVEALAAALGLPHAPEDSLDTVSDAEPPSAERPLRSRQRLRAPDSTALEQRGAILRAAKVALWAWPAFGALDLYMSLVLYPQASFALLLFYRTFGEGILAISFLVARRTALAAVRSALHVFSYATMAILISLMSLSLGGLHSRYVHGISIVVMVRAIVVPARYWRSFAWSLPIMLSFPAVHLIANLLFHTITSTFSLHDIALFASDYVFLVGSTIVGSASGHVIWIAEQQLYRARRLGRYRLEARIATGGMGEIWLAWDGTLRREVALKILRAESDTDSTAVARFEREARAASTLRNAHTIRIFDYGIDDGIRFIAMEYLPGADLAAIVATHGPMPAARAVHIANQACSSLAEAHEAGIVHRDVKPQNLFLTRVDEDYDFVKLLDFGIARVVEEGGDETLTRAGAVLGTPAYIAPEIWMGKEADARSDIYGLGATLYFLLAGKPPFDSSTSGEQESPFGALRSDAIPQALELIVRRCLAKNAEDRFQTAGELQAALEALMPPGGWTKEDARQFWLGAPGEAVRRMHGAA